MSLIDAYKKSLKPLDVEEPIDVWVHRPLAYLLALALYPTRVSPNAVTMCSIACGIAAGFFLINQRIAHHMAWAGLCIFLSAVVDCADGQLARMRKTSSNFGRMLDGMADGVVSVVIVAGGAVQILREHSGSPVLSVAIALLIAFTAVTGSLHTGSYDHYKNLFLRVTNEKYQEGEDMVTAVARKAREGSDKTILQRFVWWVYLSYFNTHDRFGLWFDPYTTRRINALPPFDAERARIFRQHNAGVMRMWRGLFGFGSMVFGFAVFAATDALDWLIVLRGIGLNLVYFGWLMPRQRRASRDGFAAMGIEPAR
ncbi:MAG TPA: CDP-alcohol phosphatidyltransferase family protein [Polyangiaceae bacterium]|nr:CDP-alcohol phosphatidyltransferase family protein [Polyangiaceae bacterium]